MCELLPTQFDSLHDTPPCIHVASPGGMNHIHLVSLVKCSIYKWAQQRSASKGMYGWAKLSLQLWNQSGGTGKEKKLQVSAGLRDQGSSEVLPQALVRQPALGQLAKRSTEGREEPGCSRTLTFMHTQAHTHPHRGEIKEAMERKVVFPGSLEN